MVHRLRCVVLEDGQTSAHLGCRVERDLRDPRPGVKAVYQICGGVCRHEGGWVPACHVGCIRLAEGMHQACLGVMAYIFEPTLSDQQARHQRLLHGLVSGWEADESSRKAQALHLHRLPCELKWDIAKHLLREYATTRLLVFLRSTHGSHVDDFSISAEVWARHVLVEGVRYIASLSNVKTSDRDRPIRRPATQSSIDTIYLCEDHLGLRQVILACSTEALRIAKRPGVWWRSYRVPTAVNMLKAHTDVSSMSAMP